MKEFLKNIEILEKRIDGLEPRLDLQDKGKRIRELEAKSLKSDFWSDVYRAKKVMQEISDLQNEVKDFQELKENTSSLKELIHIEDASTDKDKKDVEVEINNIEKSLDKLEYSLFLSGPYDSKGVILSIHSGQGGVEAMDWAAILLRMYLRYAEKSDWNAQLIDETKGEEAGIKSATVEINGLNAYGLLKKEGGTHRLVRQSPFNSDALRQTSFALVEVLPVLDEEKEIEIKQDDIEMDAFRSSAPGGQNVQKVSSAVRIRHKPSGIVVTCQSERSQAQNRENAMKILLGKLSKLKEQEHEALEKKLKTTPKAASWGTQIRSYVLHPYKMVKDLRTNVEVSNPEKVLDGNLDEFIEAEIKL